MRTRLDRRSNLIQLTSSVLRDESNDTVMKDSATSQFGKILASIICFLTERPVSSRSNSTIRTFQIPTNAEMLCLQFPALALPEEVLTHQEVQEAFCRGMLRKLLSDT